MGQSLKGRCHTICKYRFVRQKLSSYQLKPRDSGLVLLPKTALKLLTIVCCFSRRGWKWIETWKCAINLLCLVLPAEIDFKFLILVLQGPSNDFKHRDSTPLTVNTTKGSILLFDDLNAVHSGSLTLRSPQFWSLTVKIFPNLSVGYTVRFLIINSMETILIRP